MHGAPQTGPGLCCKCNSQHDDKDRASLLLEALNTLSVNDTDVIHITELLVVV